MRLTVQYVRRTKAGNWEYRRKVPKHLVAKLGKREFKQVLGRSEAQTLKNYQTYHPSIDALINKLQGTIGASGAALSVLETTEIDDFTLASANVKGMGIDPLAPVYSEADGDYETIVRDALIDQIAVKYPLDDDGHPQVTSRVDTMMIRLLGAGPKVQAPDPTIDDAARIYIEEKELRAPFEKKNLQRVERVVAEIKLALGRSPKLTELKRSHAREVRDFMLKEKGRNPETVERYLNDVRAIINKGLKEFDLHDCSNPFMGLNVTKDRVASAKSKRLPLPHETLQKITDRVMDTANKELGLIWRMLVATGCRLAEVAGLRASDVVVTGDRPHIKVEWHENRRVKDEVTIRWVPLVGDGLAAAQAALAESLGRQGPLFLHYGRQGGSDAASAALMKHVRVVTKDPKHVVHSLRHNMKDRLRIAGVPITEQNLVLGHTVGGVGEGYGSHEAVLDVTYKAMRRLLP